MNAGWHGDFQSALFDAAPSEILESFKNDCIKRLNKILSRDGKKFGFEEISIKLRLNWEIQCFDEKGDRVKEFGFSEDENLRGPDRNFARWLDDNSVVLQAYKHKNPDVDSIWVKAEKEDYFNLFRTIIPLERDESLMPDELMLLIPSTNAIKKKVAKVSKTFVVTEGDYRGLVGKLIRETADSMRLQIFGKNGKLLEHEITVLKIQVKPNEKYQSKDLLMSESWAAENFQEK